MANKFLTCPKLPIRKSKTAQPNRVKKHLKKPNPVGFWGGFIGFLVFLDKQERIGKIIQKLSNLKP